MNIGAQAKFADLCRAFDRADEIDFEIPAEIMTKIDQYHGIYCNVPARLNERERERFMLSSFLAVADLRLPESFLGEVFSTDDNVYEIYDYNYAQLYRSASFLSFKTFPLVVLMLKSNFELYDREQDHVPALQRQLADYIRRAEPATFSLPPHKVWERTIGRAVPYHWEMKLSRFAPVHSRRSGESTCFFVSHNTRQVFRSPFPGPDLKVVSDTHQELRDPAGI